LTGRELLRALAPRSAQPAKDIDERVCGLSKSLLLMQKHRQATSGQNLKVLNIINNQKHFFGRERHKIHFDTHVK
jgi:hypothetical protein